MDFAKLRATAMKDGDDEEAVTVNTRALIDKVLARYSGEWTTLRELLQNAADAQATKVIIKFETLPSAAVPVPSTTNSSDALKHVLLHHTLRRLLVTNNGQAFGVNDWNRLKRIAEGNPDETKIGAFGVGFYSVFADCEEPFVSSGNEAMAFYWKANSLFTRKLQIPTGQGSPDTSFVLDYRNTSTPMPNLLSISQFLATSLTFVALQHIELWVDDWKIVTLQKKTAPSIDVPIAKGVETKTKEGLMQVQAMARESVQMDATFMNVVGWAPTMPGSISKSGQDDSGYYINADMTSLRSFFSRVANAASGSPQKTKAVQEAKVLQDTLLEDLTATTTSKVFLRVTTANIKTSVGKQFAAELERATKKPPPKTTKVAILTSSYDETTASADAISVVARHVDIFSSVLPTKKPGGRIFIGFPTHQTTGCGIHLSAPSVIPTVERESIDLNARWVRTWNVEMLRVAGIMIRLAYTNEMAELSAKVDRAGGIGGKGKNVSKEQIDRFMPEAIHTMSTFSFGESTPSAKVSQSIEESFWTTYMQAHIEVYSSRGVLPSAKVRLAVEDLSGFVESIPVIPEVMIKLPTIQKLKDFGLLTEIVHQDIQQELAAKALTSQQLSQFISWAAKKAHSGDLDMAAIRSLFNVIVATVGEDEGSGGFIITLSSVRSFLSTTNLPGDVPVPPTTIPFQFSKGIEDTGMISLGLSRLEIVPWLRYLIETNSTRAPDQNLTERVFATKILQTLSKAFEMLDANSRKSVINLLHPLPIMPTKFGQKKPEETYFPSVKLFDDLPILIQLHGTKERFLQAIGVRKTVDLDTIFRRLLSPTPSVNTAAQFDEKTPSERSNESHTRHVELIKYLASVKDDIPLPDIERLKSASIFPAEAGLRGAEWTQGSTRLYKVSELFAPDAAIRDLKLPVIQWGENSRNLFRTVEGHFLTLLGLRTYPTVPELVDMMASSDSYLRNASMTYFFSQYHANQYTNFNVGSTPKKFLPVDGAAGTLVAPSQCFMNSKSSFLGFNILDKRLHAHAEKFGVLKDPPISECVDRLISRPPRNKSEATEFFEYFSSNLSQLWGSHITKLANAKIIPLSGQNITGHPGETHLAAHQCYTGKSSKYTDIFDFVDFGEVANIFLTKCGSKSEPTVLELANMACREPARLLGIMQSSEKYMAMLSTLADDTTTLKRDKATFKKMKASKFLMGSEEISVKNSNKNLQLGDAADDDGEQDTIKTYHLVAPSDVVINDDYISYQIFKSSLICAPTEDKLEDFYFTLGAPTLSSVVEMTTRMGTVTEKQDSAVTQRAHVLERAKLFLHQTPPENIKHNARWLENNLAVMIVSSISLRRALKGQSASHVQKRSAYVECGGKKGAILYVTPGSHETYQVSQALCDLMLSRPNPSSYLTFESFLNLNLMQLRSRGYNVDRILRAKAAEQRIVEEERLKQLQAEQQQIREQEAVWREQNRHAEETASVKEKISQLREKDLPSMPGAFGEDSPEPVRPTKSRNLFSGITRRLGIDNRSSSGEAQQQLQNFLGGGSSHSEDVVPASDPNRPPTYDRVTKPKRTEKVSSPAAIQQNLINAIQSSRAHDSSQVFSQPSQTNIKEQATYCDATPGQNVNFLADASNGVRIFVSKTLGIPTATFIADNISALNTFAALLLDIGAVYNLPAKAIHIFYDENGGTIAFNLNGSIFANFRFFEQLHRQKVEPPGVFGVTLGEAKVEAAAYWWTVIAHELAHNLVKPHTAEHSFYTEMLISNYFPKMMTKAATFLTKTPGLLENVNLELGEPLPKS
ncbi:hypothetical protein BJ878DRAFT_527121 [Calycina marina]|uniref:Sacsin/Nov domain-containing protein n=1 Tax=Calycina marina TaxID=1763456 RepID=A0A9P7YV02_9HELO|nr:hypothetical protein BJ878DRAFT_527121 [Calycina marina]